MSAAEIDALMIEDAEALRAHLDAINDAGTDFRASGMDAQCEPFLITLHGCYAETEHVFYGSPWDSEVDYGTERWCDDCNAHSPSRIDSLVFPVVILTRVIPSESGQA